MNGKLLVILAATMACSFMFLGSSHAETVNTSVDLQNNKKTATYLYSRPMLEAMYRQGVELDKKYGLQLDCKSQYNIKPVNTVVLSPIDFPDDKQHPTKGVWKFRYQLERCGDSKIYNALFIANSNGEAPTLRAFYPGSTNASPVLIKDAMLPAIMGAVVRSGLKDCKDVDVFDMRVTEPAHDVVEGDKTFKGVWKETWIFKTCGQMIDVPIRFTPDANGGGTTFTTDSAKFGDAAVKH
jgi:hypothetical protein